MRLCCGSSLPANAALLFETWAELLIVLVVARSSGEWNVAVGPKEARFRFLLNQVLIHVFYETEYILTPSELSSPVQVISNWREPESTPGSAPCVKMGRGQQMSLSDIEKSTKDADFRSTATQRRLVIVVLLVVLLPFVITSSYLYYTTPDAATEAMLFFQKRHFPSFSPLKVRRLFYVDELQIFLKTLHRVGVKGVL